MSSPTSTIAPFIAEGIFASHVCSVLYGKGWKSFVAIQTFHIYVCTKGININTYICMECG